VTNRANFFTALQQESPLQIVGVINALTAKLAQKNGFQSIYLSGAGVANTRGLPDLGLTSLNDVLYDIEQITDACSLPLLVDVDTGWGSSLNIERTFRLVSKAGAMGAHIEDQKSFKRCGHRDGKQIISVAAMCERIDSAKQGLSHNPDFMLMARTDALMAETEAETIERVIAYEKAGAKALFLEAVKDLEQYQRFSRALTIPVLANITEFGKTPLYTVEQLKSNGVKLVLYPLSAFRAMNQAADNIFAAIRQTGTQASVTEQMQTRDALYTILDYHTFEDKLNQFLDKKENQNDG
tara:strand:- start:7121 stop:8008 length:888 start_codon:yes stop_codon:yes gene_type:complete